MSNEDNTWLLRAACRGITTDLFYEEKGNVSRETKLVCEACKVKSECLEDALTVSIREDFGYRGGTSVQERRRIRKQRQSDGTYTPITLRFDEIVQRFYRV